jgi:hypothetical protein
MITRPTIILFLILSLSSIASAVEDSDRWTLAGWIAQKNRIKLMDQWLARHFFSPYEFYVGGSFSWGTSPGGPAFDLGTANAAAFVSFAGIGAQYDYNAQDPRWYGMAYLKLLGQRIHGTNLTLHGGARSEVRGGSALWNPMAGVSATLYITRYFGLDGLYRYYFASFSSGLGVWFSGYRVEGNVLLDFSLVRVFGGYFYDTESQPGPLGQNLSGGQIGMKIFF